jgi:hypothetical protein
MTDRRHSLEIEQNPKAAITVKVHEDTPEEKYVIGISAEGTTTLMEENEVGKIGRQYIAKLDKDPKLLDDILADRGPFKFYKFVPTKLVLFDVKNFHDNPRQEIDL